MSAQGYYCSTSDTVFQDREGLQQHYQSELHKYNLKRKLAGLPPVTREWFEARKAQLLNQQIQEVCSCCSIIGSPFTVHARSAC